MNLPNFLTLARIALVPVFFYFVMQPSTKGSAYSFYAVIFFGIAAVTDALDGFLARLLKKETKLGAFLDPLADKILITGGLIGILLTPQDIHKPQAWILIAILAREIIIGSGFLFLVFISKQASFHPHWLGKGSAFLQMLLIFLCLLKGPAISFLAYVSMILSIISGYLYAFRELFSTRRH